MEDGNESKLTTTTAKTLGIQRNFRWYGYFSTIKVIKCESILPLKNRKKRCIQKRATKTREAPIFKLHTTYSENAYNFLCIRFTQILKSTQTHIGTVAHTNRVFEVFGYLIKMALLFYALYIRLCPFQSAKSAFYSNASERQTKKKVK